MMIYTRSLQ